MSLLPARAGSTVTSSVAPSVAPGSSPSAPGSAATVVVNGPGAVARAGGLVDERGRQRQHGAGHRRLGAQRPGQRRHRPAGEGHEARPVRPPDRDEGEEAADLGEEQLPVGGRREAVEGADLLPAETAPVAATTTTRATAPAGRVPTSVAWATAGSAPGRRAPARTPGGPGEHADQCPRCVEPGPRLSGRRFAHGSAAKLRAVREGASVRIPRDLPLSCSQLRSGT